MRLVAFDYFRVFAILMIVSGHVYKNIKFEDNWEYFLINLMAGGSALFVFISGFFFFKVFYKRFNFKRFINKKVQNVLLPYLILVTLAIIYTFFFDPTPYNGIEFLNFDSITTLSDKLRLALTYYLTGRVMQAYWYIPFIMVIFLASPIFLKYIKLSARFQIFIYLISALIALFAHRSYAAVSTFHMVIYFTNFYLLGILCAKYYENLIVILASYKLLFLGLVLGFAAYQAWGLEHFGNFTKVDMFQYRGVDVMLLQKTALCFLFLSCAAYLETKKWSGIAILAESSFALYFLHPWAILFLVPLTYQFFEHSHGVQWLVFSLLFIAVLILSYSVAIVVKGRAKTHSRSIIGW